MAVFEVTAAPQVVWHSWGSAFSWGGYTYIGTGNDAGGMRVAVVEEADLDVTLVALIADASVTVDLHNSPGILRRSSDDRLVAVYCDHNSANIWRRVSTNPLSSDPTISGGWGAETNIDSQLTGAAYTYPDLMELDDGVYLFVRGNYGGSSYWGLAKSTDGGGSWGVLPSVFEGSLWYAHAARTSSTRIDFAVGAGSYAEDFASVYHCYFESGAYHKSDGTVITSPPFSTSDMTLAYDGATAGVRFPASIARHGAEVAIAFPVQTGTPSGHLGEDEDYVYARWDGSAWDSHTIVADVGALTFSWTEGGIAIVPDDIDRVVLSRRTSSDIAAPWRIYEARTPDAGATWTETARTTTGDWDMYPVMVRDSSQAVPYVWLKGEFVADDDFSAGIQGWQVEGILPAALGFEWGVVSPGPTLTVSADVTNYPPRLGMEWGVVLPGPRVVPTGPRHFMLTGEGVKTPEMTEALRGDGSPAEDGDVPTWHTDRKPTLEAPSGVAVAAISAAGFRGELVIASVHSTPLVFDDLVQDSEGNDLVYESL